MISKSLDVILDHRFIFSGNTMLVQGEGYELPSGEVIKRCLEYQLAQDWFSESGPNYNYTALNLETDAPTLSGCRWIPIREYMAQGKPDSGAAARAKSLLNWRRATRFCGSCGGALYDYAEETARKCIVCGRIIFPAIEPAVIVLVEKEGKLLLAKHAHRTFNMYSCLAGFVEQGESIEETVIREVREEASIEITRVRYVGSQSWPFPNQLMLAFRADWKSGELFPDKKELEDLQWFSRASLPPIPPPGSVAWRLIMGEI
jgi:NAD+ diphosphatase